MSEGGFLGVPSTCAVDFYQQIGQGCPYGTPHTDPRELTFDKEMLKKLKRAVRLIKLIKLVKLTKTVRGGEGVFLFRKQGFTVV